MLLKQIGV